MELAKAYLYQFAALIDAGTGTGKINIPKPGGGKESGLISGVLMPVYFWAAAIAVIVIVIAGFMYTTSGGDPSKVTRAKNAILAAVIGLVFILTAFGITSIVLGAF